MLEGFARRVKCRDVQGGHFPVGRGEDKNPQGGAGRGGAKVKIRGAGRGGAKKRVNRLIQKFNKRLFFRYS